MSGDSDTDHQQSESWIHERDEGEDEQVLQPKVKRKRSIRLRPHPTRAEDTPGNEKSSVLKGESSLSPLLMDCKYEAQLKSDLEPKLPVESLVLNHDQSESSLRSKRTLPTRRNANASKLHTSPKCSSRLNPMPAAAAAEDATEHSRECWNGKIVQKCNKLQRRIEKEGPQIVPLLTDLWRRSEKGGYSGKSPLDLGKIDERVDRLEYIGVTDFILDMQYMLKSALQFYGFSLEVRTEARKVHHLFFDTMKIAFPDSDFGEAQSALSFSAPLPPPSVPSPRMAAGNTGPSKRRQWHRLVTEAELEHHPFPFTKHLPHAPNAIGVGTGHGTNSPSPAYRHRTEAWKQQQPGRRQFTPHSSWGTPCLQEEEERERKSSS